MLAPSYIPRLNSRFAVPKFPKIMLLKHPENPVQLQAAMLYSCRGPRH